MLITAGNRGELLPAQFDRFGRLGDGIITTYVNFEEIPVIRERALEALARHGRPRADFPLCVYTTVRLDDDVRTAERVTAEFLATYYGGGVHERGHDGPGPGRRGDRRAPPVRRGQAYRSLHPLRRGRSG